MKRFSWLSTVCALVWAAPRRWGPLARRLRNAKTTGTALKG